MYGSCQATQAKGNYQILNSYFVYARVYYILPIVLQVQWQSEQEKQEAKSIYATEKEIKTEPVKPKIVIESPAATTSVATA